MLLAVDVGNTNISFGVYENKELKTTFRLMSDKVSTSDEYGLLISQLITLNGIDTKDIEGVIIASVVPNLMHSLNGGIERYIGVNPMIVGVGIKTGIKIKTENPKEIGADRIVDAVAAYDKYGGPVLVLDFGTATTYDLVDKEGCFCAGITAPGIRMSAKALWQDTAKLPMVAIKKPDSILAKETISSIQAGLMFGQIGQTEYIINQVRKESALEDIKVVATGGLGRTISDETDLIDIYDPSLTLDGLRIIYDRNKK